MNAERLRNGSPAASMNGPQGSEVSVLLYPGCIFFEIALALEQVAQHHTVRFYTPDGEQHRSSQGFKLPVDGNYRSLEAAEAVAVLVPGGDSRGFLTGKYPVKEALQAQMGRGALLAGICAGNLLLAYAGILKGRRATHSYTLEHAPRDHVEAASGFFEGLLFERANLVIDGNVITSQPWAYRQYAAEIAEYLQLITATESEALTRYTQHRQY